MENINPDRLRVWIYRLLLGTLPKAKKQLLKEELERKNKVHEINALEVRVLAAFTAKRPTRKYLAYLIDDWSKRTWGD